MMSDSIIFSSLRSLLHVNEDYQTIPLHWCPTEFYSITFEGWKCTLSATDESFNLMIKLASQTLEAFINLYKNTHAFTQPELYFTPEGKLGIKIGTMENERYNHMKKQQENRELKSKSTLD